MEWTLSPAVSLRCEAEACHAVAAHGPEPAPVLETDNIVKRRVAASLRGHEAATSATADRVRGQGGNMGRVSADLLDQAW